MRQVIPTWLALTIIFGTPVALVAMVIEDWWMQSSRKKRRK